MVIAYIALGANLGKPLQAVCNAMVNIGALPGTTLLRHSSLYRTAPLDAGGPDFINAVAEVSTELAAPELLSHLQRLEQQAGRERRFPNAPRTLDLDILLYGSERIDIPNLRVPHPRMNQRAFVLVPLAEIAPHLVAPDQLQAVASQSLTKLG